MARTHTLWSRVANAETTRPLLQLRKRLCDGDQLLTLVRVSAAAPLPSPALLPGTLPLTKPSPHHPARANACNLPSLPRPHNPTASTPPPSPKRPSPTPSVPMPRSRAPLLASWSRPRPPTRPPTPSRAPSWLNPTWHVPWPTCGAAGRRLTRRACAAAVAWWVVGGCCMGVVGQQGAQSGGAVGGWRLLHGAAGQQECRARDGRCRAALGCVEVGGGAARASC